MTATLALVVALLDPAALWHEARSCIDEEADIARAETLLREIVERHPHSADAERARRALVWLRESTPHTTRVRLRARDDEARGHYLLAHPNAPDAALVACHVAAGLDEVGAHRVLRPYLKDPVWGWAVQREWSRREAYRTHRLRRRLRLWKWTLAALAVVLLLGGLARGVHRRRRLQAR